MEINTLGAVLKYYREKYGIAQDNLCDGICTQAMLSKIEHGNKVVDSLVAESLLGRIGKTVFQFELLSNDEDYVLWKLREEIKKAEQRDDYIQMELLLEKYYEKMPSKVVHKQFYLYYTAKCKSFHGVSNEIICEMLYDAILLTKSDVDERDIFLCNPTEIGILLLLYRYSFSKWIKKDVEKELLKILVQVENMYSGRLKQETEIQILLELIAYEMKIGNYKSTEKYVDEAIEFLSQDRSLEHIAELHFIKAQMIEKLYNSGNEWDVKKHLCKRECLMAYYVFDIIEQQDKREELKKYCKEKLGWQITK